MELEVVPSAVMSRIAIVESWHFVQTSIAGKHLQIVKYWSSSWGAIFLLIFVFLDFENILEYTPRQKLELTEGGDRMSKNGFLVAIEGVKHSDTRRLGERLSKKLCRKGYNSIFGAEPEIDSFGNYFRTVTKENVSNMISAVTNDLNTALQFESFEQDVDILCEARRIVRDFNEGKEISKIDLQLLSFFERKFHLRSVIGHLVSSRCFVILKGYELSSFVAGLSVGISFEDLLALREKVLGRDRVRPDVTILPCPSAGRIDDCAINYEIAITRLQNTKNYGFVVRVNGDRSEGQIMAEAIRKLSRFSPALL